MLSGAHWMTRWGAVLLLAIVLGIPLGIGAALQRGSLTDGLSRLLALVGAANDAAPR